MNSLNADTQNTNHHQYLNSLPTLSDWQLMENTTQGLNPQIMYIPDEKLFELFFYSANTGEISGLYVKTSSDLIDWEEKEFVLLAANPIDFQSFGVKTFTNTSSYVDGVVSYNDGPSRVIRTLNVENSIDDRLLSYMGNKIQNAVLANVFIAPNNNQIDQGDYSLSVYVSYLDTFDGNKLVYRPILSDAGDNVGNSTMVASSSTMGNPSITYTNGIWHAMYMDQGSLNIVSSSDGKIWNINYFSSLYQPHQFILKDNHPVAVLVDDEQDLLISEFVEGTWSSPIQFSPDNGHTKEDSQLLYLGNDSWLLTYQYSGITYIFQTNNFVLPHTIDETLGSQVDNTSITPSNTTNPPPVITNIPKEPTETTFYSDAVIFIGILIFLIFGFRYFTSTRRKKSILYPSKPITSTSRASSARRSTSIPQRTPIDKLDKVPMKHISELGRNIRTCCYQTARLKETYCWCGRGIPEDLQLFFE
ncbi:MAG: hypothetical protein ACXAD7_18320 [Candidatus Kariarchaeaceae archaeon]